MESAQVCRQLQLANASDNFFTVAFASSDQHQVDQHFASASRFAVYGIGEKQLQLMKIIEMNEPPSGHRQDNIEMRLDILGECLAVYVVAVGDAVVRQLWERGVRPVRVAQGSSILALLGELQRELTRQRSPLRRQMSNRQVSDDENWQEYEDNDEGEPIW